MDAFDNPARGANGLSRADGDVTGTATASGEARAIALADTAAGITAAASAIPLAIQAVLVPDAQGRITLPAGVSIDDISVSGPDLIITLPDGQVIVVPNGAVAIPAIVVDGNTVPASTVAQLLEGLDEFNPEAGLRSSGGNFADPEGAIQDAYDLGDLLPYTELAFPAPRDEELIPDRLIPDEDATVVIQTPDQPAGSTDATSSVDEAGLPARGSEPAGSNSAATSETTSGTIVIDAPDGLASVTINGTAVTSVGQTIATPLGTLTITSIAPGAIGYSYTLADNTDANANPTDVFTVVVTDADGDTASANLTISVIDDVPTARADTDAVAPATYTAETGNVISGAGTTSGSAGADTQGADGATLTGIVAGTGTAFVAPGTAIAGQYGTLTINADGSYSYVRAPDTPGGVNDVFTYRLADGDGDTSTATLTISIGDSPAIITFVPTEGAGTLVDEAQLPPRPDETPGSEFDGDDESTTGTITFTSPDGVQSVTINGVAVTPGALPQTIFTDATGVLVVNSYAYDPATGQGSITYTYTLADNTADPDGTTVSFDVVVTDLDGDSAPAVLNIDIVDDVPIARDDADSVTEDGPLVADGNLLTGTGGSDANATDGVADTQGADGASVTAIAGGSVGTPFATAYGTLTVNADGSYTYALNNALQPVQGLSAGETLSESFVYTITDGDGDTSTATLTITINGADDGVTITGLDADGGELTVDEDDLPNGSSPDDAALTQGGSFSISTPDGLGNVSVGGTQVVTNGVFTAGSATSPLGTVNITGFTPVIGADGSVIGGSFTYEYVLSANTLTHGSAGEDSVTDSFAVTVTDSDGSVGTASLDVNIVDDVPTAGDDADNVTEDGPLVADGNLLTGTGGSDANATDGVADTQGADGASVTAIAGGSVGTPFATAYGTLTVNADGSYTYALNNALQPVQGLSAGETLSESFVYTITDGDGDTSTATLTITINGADDGVTITGLEGAGAELAFDEDDLPARPNEAAGSDTTPEPVTDGGNFSVSTPDGMGNVVLDSFNGSPIGPLTLVTADGSFTQQSVANAYGTLSITAFTPVTGTDGSVIGGTFTYSYTLADNRTDHPAGGEDNRADSIGITVTDSDGSSASDTIDIQITDDVPLAVNDALTQTLENQPVTINVLANDVQGADSVQPNAVTLVAGTLTGGGTLINNGNGSFTYTQLPGETGDVSFQYKITDGDGDTSIATATITLVADSQPQIRNADNVTVDEDGLLGANADNGLPGEVTSTGSTSANGSITVDYGSDIPAPLVGSLVLNDSAALDTQLTVGTVPMTFAKDGADLVGSVGATEVIRITLTTATAGPGATEVTYGYTVTLSAAIDQAIPGSEDSDILAGIGFTVTDSDGSTTSGSFSVTIVDDLPTLTVSDTPTSVVEGATANGSWTLDAGADGVQSVTVSFGTGSAALNLTPGASVTIVQPVGTLTVNADGTFSFTAAGNQNNNLNPSASFTLSAVDRDGDPTSDSLTIAITDGANPTGATPITLTVDEAALSFGGDAASNAEVASGDLSFTAGSDTLSGFAFAGVGGLVANLDGAGTDIFWTMAPDGQTITGALTSGGPAAITISLSAPASIAPGATASATVTVTLADNLPHALAMAAQTQALGTVTVQATDTDGDVATGVVTVAVTDDVPTARADADSVTEDGALVADGNVLTGVGGGDANATDGVADTQGADGASVTALAGGTIGNPLAGSYGTLTLNADGSYSYVLDNANTAVQGLSAGEMLSEVFTYTITDGDGDTSSTTLTITINGADDGVTITGLDAAGAELFFDEDDLPARPGEAPGSDTMPEPLTDSSSFSVSTPDGMGTVVIDSFNGVPLGAPLTLVVANGSFTPQSVATAYGTLSITAFTPVIASDGSVIGGTFTYSYTLADNRTDHPAAGEDNRTDSIGITVTDSDGSSASATIDIQITDDVPTASAEPNQNVAEGTTVTGTLDFVQGADSASVTAINGVTLVFGGDGFSQAIDIGDGTIKVKADGSYSFTADASVIGTGSASATYTVTDGDGDTSTAPISFTITDANVPTAGTTLASVDDDALAGGNPASTVGDLPDPDSDGDNNQATFGGLLTLSFGGDGAGSVNFAAMHGQTATVGTELVTYGWNAGNNTLTATGPRGVLFTVEVTNPATGAYEVTLVDNVLHTPGGNENDALASLSYTVSDADGSLATGTLQITFDDDAPTLGTIPNGTASNNPAAATTVGTLPFIVGADSPASVGTITANVIGITSGGRSLVTNQSGNVLTAYADVDNDGVYDPGLDTAVFTLTVDVTTNQYVFDLIAPLDPDVVDTPISGASSFGAGPTQSQILTGLGSDVAIVAGWIASGSFNAATWYSTGAVNPPGLNLSSINGSTNGWGIANQNFNQGEFMRFDFGSPIDDLDGAGGYTPPAVTLPEVSFATFTLTNFTGADTLQFVVHYTDGTFGNLTTTGAAGTVNIQAPLGKLIDWVDIYGQTVGSGGGKISLTNAGVTTSTLNETIGFNVTLTDSDGDPVSGSFTVNVVDNSPNAVNDEVSLTEGGPSSVTFDVDTNDDAGADGFGSRTFASLTGTYGNLTLNGDGTQTYTLNAAGQTAIDNLAPGATLTDNFNYTLTDTDGDSDSARVTVTLTGTDDPVTITNLTPAANGGDATVDEDDLPGGSSPNAGALTQAGTFTISAPDGVANLTIHGTQVIADGVFTAAAIATPLGNTLNITGYNAATGIVSYSYTLAAAETHASANGQNELFEDFNVSLTDTDGDNTTDTLSVRIVDDVPVANAGPALVVDETAGPTAGTNLLANDVQGADGATVTAVSFDGGSSWTPIPVVGTVVTTAQGVYNFSPNGNWTFDPTPNPSAANQNADFTYEITDADGDKSTAAQTMTAVNSAVPLFLVGSNQNDQTGQTADHVVPNPQGPVDGPLQGSVLDDTIIGDPGAVTVTPGQTANVVLVLDSSGSMTSSINFGGSSIQRIQALKDGVNALIDSLSQSGGQNIRVTVIDFDSNATNLGTFNLIVNGVAQTSQINAAKAAVNSMNASGNTNYEAAIQAAHGWITGNSGNNDLPNADINKVVFVSDGEPQAWINTSGGTSTGDASRAMDELLGLHNPQGSSNDDRVNDVAAVLGANPAPFNYTIDAIGITVGSTALGYLSDVEDGVEGSGGGGSALNVTSAEQLAAALSVLGASENLADAANDTINGGDGNDVIFGDVVNSDALATQLGVNLAPGSGWAVFQTLENRPNNESIDPAGNGADWTRADTIAYIRTNHAALSLESGRNGGNDTINGGAGDDIIYGQEGNDVIDGGDGNDFISGGSGVDAISGGTGNDVIIAGTGSGSSVNAGVGADRVIIEAGSLTATNWTVNLGSDNDADKVIFNHTSVGDAHQTVATVTNFAVATDKVAVTVNSQSVTDGSFVTVTGTQTDIGAGVEVVELVNSAWTTASLGNDGNGSAIEGFIQAATDDIPTGTYTFIVYSSTDTATADAGIYSVTISDSTNPGSSEMVVEHIMTLSGVGYGNLSASNFVGAADPIILDLTGDGYAFGATADFDIDGDGVADRVTWNSSNDGILAADLDGNGVIDSGTELFTPGFAGGSFASGVAALASLDSNGDGVVDARDPAFASLRIWQDANADGVSDAGELATLADHGIAAISAGAAETAEFIDGQAVTARGSFLRSDGSTGGFVEVQLDTQLGSRTAARSGDDQQRTAGNQALTHSLVAASLVAMAHDVGVRPDAAAKLAFADDAGPAVLATSVAAATLEATPSFVTSLGEEAANAAQSATKTPASAVHFDDPAPLAVTIDAQHGRGSDSGDLIAAKETASEALFDMASAHAVSPMDGLLTLGLAQAALLTAEGRDAKIGEPAANAVLAEMLSDNPVDQLIAAVTGSEGAAHDLPSRVDLAQLLEAQLPADMAGFVHQSVDQDLHQLAVV